MKTQGVMAASCRKLVYLGGNGLNCEIEFLDAYTMVCRNGDRGESFGDMQKLGYESRFHQCSLPVDDSISKITGNVLNRFLG